MRDRSGSSDPVADPAPADVRNERQRTIRIVGVVRVINEYRPPTHIFARNEAPVTAVLGVVPIVTHHEIMTSGNNQRSPIVVGGNRRRCPEAGGFQGERLLPVEQPTRLASRSWIYRRQHSETLALLNPVDIEEAVPHVNRVTRVSH